MSRIIGATLLLLIILVDNIYAATASRVEFRVSKVHIRKCGCRVFPGGIKCRSPLFPKILVKKQELIKCFCSTNNQANFPEFQAACKTWRPGYPLTLL